MKKKKSKTSRGPVEPRLRYLSKYSVQHYLEDPDVVVLVLSKRRKRGESKRKIAEFAAAVDTRSRVEGIIRGYGMVPIVNGSTIVGPAVPSMAHFIGDVNRSFGKDYGPDKLKADWDVDTTANFIDTH